MTSPKRLIAGIVIGVLGLMADTSTAATWHVSPTGDNANDGATWATAKQTIQAGVDAAASYDTVLVNDGTYVLTEQITVSTPMYIRSVSGPTVTIIDGNGQVTSNRCFYLGSDCTLDGFTVSNGLAVNTHGGGIYCVTEETIVTNCIIANNEASGNGFGGGVFAGLFYNCVISNNFGKSGGGCFAGILNNCTIINNAAVSGGGAYGSTLNNCTISENISNSSGGGASGGTLNNCTISENTASSYGGGASGGTLNNCTINGNTANFLGGGAFDSTLNNCTISENTSSEYGGGASGGTLNNCIVSNNTASLGGGACDSTLNNCLISHNTASYGGGLYVWSGYTCLNNCTIIRNTALYGSGAGGSTLNNCIVYYNYGSPQIDSYDTKYTCSPDAPAGNGNITNEPMFVDKNNGNFRLSAISPCINHGDNQYAPTNVTPFDLDGNARIFNSTVDMGAYEYGSSPPSPIVATPIFNPDGGVYSASMVTVTVSSATAGATIRYTTNGTDPTETSMPISSGSTVPVPIPGTLKAKAWKDGMNPSEIKSADYNSSTADTVTTPVFSPDGGAHSGSSVTVTVSSATTGAVILYTANGSDPTEFSAVVASGGTVSVPVPGTLKAKAWKTGMNPSAVKSANYTLLIQPPAAPVNVSANDGAYTNKITVEWTLTAGATGYRIFRNISDNSATAEEIGTPSTTTYDDTTATSDTTYYYWVKAVNADGASDFSAPDTGYLGVIGPLVTANGMVGDNIHISAADPVTIAVEMMNLPAEYLGFDVDWWVVVYAHTGGMWFYFDSAFNLTPYNGNLANCRPAYQGPLYNVPPQTLVENMLLPPGTYKVWFAVDYPMDGILGLDGANLLSRATIIVDQ